MDLIPAKIPAGVTVEIPVTLTAYPAPAWQLALALRGPGVIDLQSAPDGATHIFSETATVTADWVPGAYWWQLRATDGTDVVEVGTGQTTIAADLSKITEPHDGRSHAEKVLSAIEAVIEGRASVDQQAYTIQGRSLQRTPLADLLTLRAKYRAEVRAEQQAARRGQSLIGRAIKVRFTG